MDLEPLEHGQGASDRFQQLLMLDLEVNELNNNFLQMTSEQKKKLKRLRNYYVHGIKQKEPSVLAQSSETQVSSEQNKQSYKPQTLINLLWSISPEEAVADLAALRQRLKRSNNHPTYIQLRMAWAFLCLLWAVLQIKIENLWLPKQSSTRQDADSLAPIDVNISGEVETASIDIVSASCISFTLGGSSVSNILTSNP